MEELKNPLSNKHFHKVCKSGQGADCCRYVVAGSKGIECAKFSSLKEILDKRVAEESMVARGDNCAGVPDPKF